MVNIRILTDESQVWFSDTKTNMTTIPHTRYCIEMISDELYDTLFEMVDDPEHTETVCTMLYKLLCKKAINNN